MKAQAESAKQRAFVDAIRPRMRSIVAFEVLQQTHNQIFQRQMSLTKVLLFF